MIKSCYCPISSPSFSDINFYFLPPIRFSAGKVYAGNAGDLGSTPGLGRSLEEVMATHPSILAGESPRREETGRLWSKRVAKSWTWANKPLSIISVSSVAQSCLILCHPMNHTARQASLPITNSWSRPKPMPIESVMSSNYLIRCRPAGLNPSQHQSLYQVAKVLEFQL